MSAERKNAAKCGTYSGYQRHTRGGSTPCEPCLAANREYHRAYTATETGRRNSRRVSKAQTRAQSALVSLHRDEYERLYDAYMSELLAEGAGRRPVTAFLTLPAATLAQVSAPTLAQAYAVDVILADLADDLAAARESCETWGATAYDYRAWGIVAGGFVLVAADRLTSAGVL